MRLLSTDGAIVILLVLHIMQMTNKSIYQGLYQSKFINIKSDSTIE